METPKSRVFSLKRNNNPTCAAFINDGTFAAVGTDSGRILLLPLIPNKAMKKFPGHKKAITTMDINYNTNTIVTGSEDTTVQVLKDKETNVIRPNDGVIKFVSVSQQSPLALIVGEDGSPSIWNTETFEPVILMKQFSSNITAAAMAPNGKIFAIATEENGCSLYNAENGSYIITIQTPNTVSCIAISEEKPYIAFGLVDGYVMVYNYVHHNILTEREIHRSKVIAIALHPTSDMLVSSSEDGELHVSNPLNLKPRFSVEGNEGVPITIKFSQDGLSYITASNKQKIYIFESPSEEEMIMYSDSEEEDVIEEQSPQYSINTGYGNSNAAIEEDEEDEEEEYNEAEKQEDPEEIQKSLVRTVITKLYDIQKTMNNMEDRLKIMSQQMVQIEKIQKKRSIE